MSAIPVCMMTPDGEACRGYHDLLGEKENLARVAFLLLRSLGYSHDAPDGGNPVDRIVNPQFPTTDQAAKRLLETLRGERS